MDLNSNQTLTEVLQSASVFLEQAGFDGQLSRTYWMMIFDWDLTQLVQQLRQPVTITQQIRYQAALNRIIQHEPIQYIVGYADFLGSRYEVTPDTLIPREDSAGIIELAQAWLKQYSSATHILDIGTGSGILAIELAKIAPQAQVTGVDISAAALAIAVKNASKHHTDVNWIESDLLSALNPAVQYDLIVSNPPYIGRDELAEMDESVIRYEPEQALFAEEEGLAIYRRLARDLAAYLAPTSRVIMEIGYRQGSAVAALFELAFPTGNVSVHQDLNGHDRYVVLDLVAKEEANGDPTI